MKVVFVSDSFHHHQQPFSDEMYKLTNGEYFFIATGELREERKNMGWGIHKAPPYLIFLNEKDHQQVDSIKRLIAEADLAITGSAPLSLFSLRNKYGKITFRYSERLYKTKSRYLKLPVHTYNALRMKNDYMLCSSAYTAGDYSLSGCYVGRCYKWGYFTELRHYPTLSKLFEKKAKLNEPVRLLWVSRFVKLKRPDIVLQFAELLKRDGVSFSLNMVGAGPLRTIYQNKICMKNLSDCVSILDPMSPNEVRDLMETSDIFLFTSNREEGWGAVMNESMNSGCAVLANYDIGSIPFLIKEGTNGEVYDEDDLPGAYMKLKRLIEDYEYRRIIAENAYETINSLWNPLVAAQNVLSLYQALQLGHEFNIKDGPCSIALPLNLKGQATINYPKFSILDTISYFIRDILH